MVRNILLASTILALSAILVAVGCGGDGSGGSDPVGSAATGDLKPVVTRYDNGQIATEGQVDAQGRRQGHWQRYSESGAQLFDGHFVDGEVDESKPWTEWNADGSTRFDHSDGAYPLEQPF